MKKRYKAFRKASLILGVVTLLLGMLPLTSLPGASVIFADDTPPGPPIEIPAPGGPKNENTPEEPPLKDPLPPEPEETTPPLEDPLEEEPLIMEMQFSLLSSSSSSGPSSQTPDELGLPEDQGAPGYQNDCDLPGNDCEKVDGVGEDDPVNQVGEGETYDKNATVVVIKAGTQEFFFTPSGPECDATSDPYCVTWNDDGTITVVRNGEGRDIQDISNIQFWNPDDGPEDPPCECEGFAAFSLNGGCECEEVVYGCLDIDADNYDPNADVHDQSVCEYEDPEDPGDPDDPSDPGSGGGITRTSLTPPAAGGPTEELLLIPVTGADLSGGLAGLQALLRSAGLAFMGAAAVAEGLSRRKTR